MYMYSIIHIEGTVCIYKLHVPTENIDNTSCT
jgi:hypothetical protein